MEIFERINKGNKVNLIIPNIKIINNNFTTRDIYIHQIILIKFNYQNDTYFCVSKTHNPNLLKKYEIYSYNDLINKPISDCSILAIDHINLKYFQFEMEQTKIGNFITNLEKSYDFIGEE